MFVIMHVYKNTFYFNCNNKIKHSHEFLYTVVFHASMNNCVNIALILMR